MLLKTNKRSPKQRYYWATIRKVTGIKKFIKSNPNRLKHYGKSPFMSAIKSLNIINVGLRGMVDNRVMFNAKAVKYIKEDILTWKQFVKEFSINKDL